MPLPKQCGDLLTLERAIDGLESLWAVYMRDDRWLDGWRAAVQLLADTKGSIITTGVGKSGHVARKTSSSLASLGIVAFYVHPTEAGHGDLGQIRAGDGILAFSHSGETLELDAITTHARWLNIPLVLVTSVPTSKHAAQATATVAYPAVPEAFGQAPTTSSTQQMVIGDMLTIAIAERRGITPDDLLRNHPGGSIGRGT